MIAFPWARPRGSASWSASRERRTRAVNVTHTASRSDSIMGLFSSFKRAARRPSSKVNPGGPGAAASIEPLTQDTITFDDFKAEVTACGLGADWGGARLEKLFALFDLDGNGALDSDEFKRAARQLHTLLEALEDVPAKQALSAPRS